MELENQISRANYGYSLVLLILCSQFNTEGFFQSTKIMKALKKNLRQFEKKYCEFIIKIHAMFRN